MPGSDLAVRVGYAVMWNNSKGSDFAFVGNGVFAGFKKSLFYKFSLEGSYDYGAYRYTNLNSLSGVGGFNFKTNDNTSRYRLQLERPITKEATLL